MPYGEVALIAFLVDRVFGEFRFLRHPVVLMGDYISFFESRLYKDSVAVGALLTLSLLGIVFVLSFLLSALPFWAVGVIASTGIAGNMLYSSIVSVLDSEDKRAELARIVSRDTADLTESQIYKGAIESYGENLSDGVVAPLFYLLLFGIVGLFLYKAVNTLDSMVGYRTKRYEKFGKFSARLGHSWIPLSG